MSRLHLLREEMYQKFPGEGEARLGPDVYAPRNFSNWPGSKLTPGPSSVPRGVLTDKNQLPSTRDIFSKRVPDLSFGHPQFGDLISKSTPDYKRGDRIGELDTSEEPLFSLADVRAAVKYGTGLDPVPRRGISGSMMVPPTQTPTNPPASGSFYIPREAAKGHDSTAVGVQDSMIVDPDEPSQETVEGHSQSTQASISTTASSVDDHTSLTQSSETITPASRVPASPPKRALDEADDARLLLKRVRIHSDEGQI